MYKCLFPYCGGKFYQIKRILLQLPAMERYIDGFGGAANILINKPPSPVEIYNDIDSNIVNLMRVLQDDGQNNLLRERWKWVLHSREEFYFCRKKLRDECDPVMRAYCFLLSLKLGFGGRAHKASFNISKFKPSLLALDFDYIFNRLKNVIIENLDIFSCLKNYDDEKSVFYLDPPYLSTKGSRHYGYKFDVGDHADLVEILLHIKGKCLLSGYDHEVYVPLKRAGWNFSWQKRPVSCSSKAQKDYAIEFFAYNF